MEDIGALPGEICGVCKQTMSTGASLCANCKAKRRVAKVASTHARIAQIVAVFTTIIGLIWVLPDLFQGVWGLDALIGWTILLVPLAYWWRHQDEVQDKVIYTKALIHKNN